MYDFANSGYTTVVITAVFNAYFVAVVCAGASWGTFAWTLALSVSYAMHHLHCADHRRVCRRARGEEEIARDHDVGVRARHRALVAGRAR